MRRRTLVAAGVTTAALLVGTAGVVALTRPHETPAAAAPAAPVPAAVESACGLAGSGPGTRGAAATTWTDVAGWPLPVSPTDGPGRRDPHGPWSCYTRTQSGAVLAAYVITARASGLADDWQRVVREQTMPGPGQAVLLGSVPNFSSVTTPRGFDVAAYSPNQATVRYRLSFKGGEFSCTMDVQWSGGDWRLVLGDDGSTSSGCVRGVPEDFTPWGPS